MPYAVFTIWLQVNKVRAHSMSQDPNCQFQRGLYQLNPQFTYSPTTSFPIYYITVLEPFNKADSQLLPLASQFTQLSFKSSLNEPSNIAPPLDSQYTCDIYSTGLPQFRAQFLPHGSWSFLHQSVIS